MTKARMGGRDGRLRAVSRLMLLAATAAAVTVGTIGILQRPGTAAPQPAAASAAQRPQLVQLPLRFEAHAAGSYFARGPGYALALTADSAALRLRGSASAADLQLRLQGAEPRMPAGEARAPGTANYFVGSDPAQWRTALPLYGRVRYAQVYPGIDLVYYGRQQQLEYDFEVAAGADPARIRLQFDGADALQLDDAGNLLLRVDGGELVQHRPVVYQQGAQGREIVQARYTVAANTVAFELGDYDRSRALVIDPVLSYSTYLGGVAADDLYAMVAADGGIVVAGSGGCETSSGGPQSFPTTAAAFDTLCLGNEDAYVAKLNPEGSDLVFSTFVGGRGDEQAFALAADADGNLYVGGTTRADDSFPLTAGAYDTTPGGSGDGFLVKLSGDGTQLLYGTLIGGGGSGQFDDVVRGIALDPGGTVYLTGRTDNRGEEAFPVTAGAFDTTPNGDYDAFVAALDLAGEGAADLLWCTLLGGSVRDTGYAIAVDSSGVYLAGSSTEDFATGGQPYPTTANALERSTRGSNDVFFTKLARDGASLLYSTLIGSDGNDEGYALAIDAQGMAYLGGVSSRLDGFPSTPGSFDPTQDVDSDDAFVLKLDPRASGAASLVWGTFLGGSGFDGATALALGVEGKVYVTGHTGNGTGTTQFPVTPGAFANLPQAEPGVGSDNVDGFLAVLSADGSELLYGSFFGGRLMDRPRALALDAQGQPHFGGITRSTDLPLTTFGDIYQTSNRGNGDAFVTRFGAIADASAQFGSDSFSVREAGGSALIAVTRLGSSTGPFQVDYRTAAGTAHPGGDYRNASGTLAWLDGESASKTFTVGIIDDEVDDPDRTVRLILSSPSGRLGTPAEATLTIVDDDLPPSPGMLRFAAAAAGVPENAGLAQVTVERIDGSLGEVSVLVSSADGSAGAGSDYAGVGTTLSFADGETSKTVAVQIVDDSLDENDETFSLNLSSPGGGVVLGTPASTTLTIVDDDAAPAVRFAAAAFTAAETAGSTSPELRLSVASARTVSVAITRSGTATVDQDYGSSTSVSFPAGSVSQPLPVTLIDDALVEPAETAVFTLHTPVNATLGETTVHTLTITSEDAESAGSLQFSLSGYSVVENAASASITVTRSGGGAGAVAASFTTADGTATAAADYTATMRSVNFADGDSEPKTVLVPILDDTLDESDETVTLRLSAPTGGATLGANVSATLTIVDDDAPPFEPGSVQLAGSDFSVGENAGPGMITLTRTGGSSGPASVQFSTGDDSAAAPGDYTPVSVTVTWADGDAAAKSVPIPVTNDALVEGPERLSLSLSNVGGATLGTPAAGFLTIVDDDQPPPPAPGSLRFAGAALSVREGTPTLTVSVQRVDGDDGAVSVRYASANGSAAAGADYGGVNGTLSWADGDSAARSFSVAITDDQLAEVAETFGIALSAPTGGALLGTPGLVTVTIADNDSSDLSGTSGGGSLGGALVALLGFAALLRRRALHAGALALLAAAPLAQAQQPGFERSFYAGLRGGPAHSDRSSAQLTTALREQGYGGRAEVDDDDVAAMVYAGWWLSPDYAMELAVFDLGEYSARIPDAGGNLQALARRAAEELPASRQGLALSLRPLLRLSDRLALDFRAGLVYGRQESEVRGEGVAVRVTESEFGLMVGSGLLWRIGRFDLGAGVEAWPQSNGTTLYPAYGLVEYRFGAGSR